MSGSNALADVFNNANRPTVAPGNLLDYANQAGSVAERLNANRLFQANALRGQLLQQATDANGNVDMPTFNRLAAGAGPGYAPAASAGLDQSARIAGQQQEQAAVRNGYLGQQLGALLDLPDAQLNHGLAATAGRIRDSGMFPAGQIDIVLSHLPSDPAALRTQLRQVQLSLQAPGAQQGQTYGTTGTQTGPGGVTIGTVQQPAAKGGGVSASSQPGAPQGPGADQLSGVSTITDSQGTPHTDTLFGHIANGRVTPMGTPAPGYSVAPATGGDYSRQPLMGGMKTPVPGSADDLTTPTMPGQTEAAPGDYKVTPPLPRSGPRSGGTTGPAPGVVEGQRKTAEDSAGAFKEVSDQGVAAQSRGAVLDNMLSDTSQFSTGPGADIIARVRAVANRLGYNVNTEGLSAAESFKKLAAALNANQGSDARLSVSEASNPHADLSPAGIDLMIRQLRGNEDYTLARAKLAATYPNRTDKTGFEAKVGAQLDPRTFQYDRMTPGQKSTFFKSIDDKDKFIKAHDAATALGGR